MGAKGTFPRVSRVFGPEPFEGAPELGRRPDGGAWPDSTVEWWAAVSRLPHAAAFEPSDWAFARWTGFVHALSLERPSSSLFAELRVREERLGATEVGRARLGIRYEEPVSAEPRARRASGDLRLVDDAVSS